MKVPGIITIHEFGLQLGPVTAESQVGSSVQLNMGKDERVITGDW
jgi:hypothetical protein